MMRVNKKRLLLLLVFAAVLLTVGLAVAGGGETLPRSLVSSGGEMISQSGYTLHNAIGQPVVGAVENGHVLCSGYLCSAGAPPVSGANFYIYLPSVIR